MKNFTRKNIAINMLCLALLLVSACGRQPDAEKCDDPAKTVATEKTVEAQGATPAASADAPSPDKKDQKDVMWCRACVVGPAGFMSCQTVRPADTGEAVDALRDRARVAACTDAGFPKDNCPAKNVISTACKGDPPPADETAAGKAMLDALKGSGPVVLTKDGKTVPNIMYQEPSGPGAPAPGAADAKPASTPDKAAPHIE